MRNDFRADDFVIACQSDLETALTAIALAHRMVFFAGLPGVGKSLLQRSAYEKNYQTVGNRIFGWASSGLG